MSGLFNPGFHTLETALAARERLQSTHSANIANADTPNYRADTRTFADFLRAERSRQMNSEMMPGQLESLATSDGGRLDSRQQAGERRRLDGNTVDIQKEMGYMAENQLMHELTMRLIKGRLNGLANAIKEGGR